AAAAQDRIALDQLVIHQLPEMLRAAAQGLQGANLTVLDGAEGLNSVVASLATQGMALLETVRNGMASRRPPDPARPSSPSVTRHELPGTGCPAGSPGRLLLRCRRWRQVIENNLSSAD